MTIFQNGIQIKRGYYSYRKFKIMKNETHITKVRFEFVFKTNFQDESSVRFGLKRTLNLEFGLSRTEPKSSVPFGFSRTSSDCFQHYLAYPENLSTIGLG